jgi:site-specific recombinase XerD
MPKRQASLPRYLEESECERLLEACDGPFALRDYCILMLFMSCGLRISELVSLNLPDIYEDHLRVIGKGNKERPVYFNARTKLHLQQYLNERTDNNPALFVSLSSPYSRLTISGVEVRIRTIGNRLDMQKVHPHKFRRTLATMAIDKGMPIEQVQRLLGHVRIDTTLQYAIVNQNNVKMAHKKYLG